MAKRKKAQPWDAVFDRVRVSYRADVKYPPKTMAVELDAVGAELGFQFPLSYSAFAQSFGLGGHLRGEVELFTLRRGYFDPEAPMEYPSSVVERTIASRNTLPEYYHASGRIYSVTEIERLVRFASDYGGREEFYFFPTEITNRVWRECRIYSRTRTDGLLPVAASFAEWLCWVNTSFADPEAEEFPENYPRVFKPKTPLPDHIPYSADVRYTSHKTAPAEADVALWLTWNNNTARDLALSIRDHGQTDAFPILADALQEAGCDNADLLDSCRTGDPDIDGIWVLRVLLGES